MVAAESSARRSSRARNSGIDGGRTKIDTTSSPSRSRTWAAPCQSMSNSMSRPCARTCSDRRPRRAVAVAVHLRPFEQVAVGLHPLELAPVDEVIVDAVDLGGAARPGGHRDRQRQVERLVLHQHARQRRLARARGRGQDQDHAASGGLRRFGAHSMFCACSRNCSICARSSSPWAVRLTSFDLAHERARLAGKLLREEIEPAADRPALFEKRARRGDVGLQSVEFLADVGLGRRGESPPDAAGSRRSRGRTPSAPRRSRRAAPAPPRAFAPDCRRRPASAPRSRRAARASPPSAPRPRPGGRA